ncbi:D-lactate dehydrogenase [Psittacicella melopsittaci]|uniref:D-lactate dehydrogenase n=1 Tax=Psittacicella melopsittaci TaxID=2028576 RepID=A0A3A1Y691_9GAMM|nr:D-lactate dehydrogenase [Psittacicella melopsittaci]RIY32800.1 D-lactate dehydrogenase [Psittacicella melopsittaci]
MSETYKDFLKKLTEVVGDKYVLTDPAATKRYRTGFFFGLGDALAVVRPGSLVEYYKVVKLCVENNIIVLNQAQNTGVTGGSTPWGNDYDRPIVIINTLRIDDIEIIRKDTDEPQAVCFAGSTLFKLEEKLAKIGREPHSVIGSSCIGASVVGGICNNSGGTLVQRGPAYTELACYARVNDQGELEFINNLGIDLGDGSPEEQLARLEKGDFDEKDVHNPEGKLASSRDYKDKVVLVDADTPSRYNSDPERLKEASGSAGHLAVFAVRVDTFAKPKRQQLFFIGTNSPEDLNDIRRTVLTKFDGLPMQGEYMGASSFDDAVRFGKDVFWVLDKFGTKHLPRLYSLKDFYDRKFGRFSFLPSSETIMQFYADCLPNLLPARILDFRRKYQHFLILTTTDDLIDKTDSYLKEYFDKHDTGSYFAATPKEAKKALLLRFSVGGSLARSMHVLKNETKGMIALDIALRRNDDQWAEPLPAEILEHLTHVNSCGHFLCHVFHLDYLVKKDSPYSVEEIKEKILAFYRDKGAQYPAEHNVGHLYHAQPALEKHYRELDPTNQFNPGVGKLSKFKYWSDVPCSCDHHKK